MSDLISRQKAREVACSLCRWAGTPNCEECEHPIDDLPTIDAVPVVRCKDCKHNYGKEHCEEFNPEDIVCDYWDTDGLNEYDFCSRGDRSE